MLRYKGIIVHPEDLTPNWIERMAAAGLNDLGLHPVGGKLAHESLERAIAAHDSPESRSLRDMARANGLRVEYEAHAMAWLMPRSLFDEHPDWFRMAENGARTADFNMCASNEAALEYLSERTALLANLTDTGSDRYYFWTDDVCDCSCNCPACRKLTPSDQQLVLVNAMLRGIKRINPNAKLCYLAYHDALEAPKTVRPDAGVFLEYAPIGRDHHRTINDPDCPQNVAESAPLRALLEFFGRENSRVLEYWMDNSLFSNWTKPPKQFALDADVMRKDVEFYTSLGFEEITSFGCYLGPDYEELYGMADLSEYGRLMSE